jgi:hypothetical protein
MFLEFITLVIIINFIIIIFNTSIQVYIMSPILFNCCCWVNYYVYYYYYCYYLLHLSRVLTYLKCTIFLEVIIIIIIIIIKYY